MTTQAPPVPAHGSVWAVTNLDTQALPHSLAKDGDPHLEHAINLQSLADDRTSEELTVGERPAASHTEFLRVVHLPPVSSGYFSYTTEDRNVEHSQRMDDSSLAVSATKQMREQETCVYERVDI